MPPTPEVLLLGEGLTRRWGGLTAVDQVSLGLALVLGTAGMPHILMRFFTVPDAKQARVSVIWAMAIIGGFYVLTLIIGNGAALNVGAAMLPPLSMPAMVAAPTFSAAPLPMISVST